MIALQHAAAPADPALVRAAIDTILAEPEFRPEQDTLGRWLAHVGERILEWLADVFGITPHGVGWILMFVLAAALLFGAYMFARALVDAARRRRIAGESSTPDPEVERAERVRKLRERARAARQRGEFLLALRLEFTALVVGLGERGDLDYRDAFTNRELLERGRPGPEAKRILAPIVPALDSKSFGGEIATEGDVAQMSALCDRLLGGVRA